MGPLCNKCINYIANRGAKEEELEKKKLHQQQHKSGTVLSTNYKLIARYAHELAI